MKVLGLPRLLMTGVVTMLAAAFAAPSYAGVVFPAAPNFKGYVALPAAPAPQPDPAPKPDPNDPQPPGGGFPKLPPGLPSLPPGSKWTEITSKDPTTTCAEGAAYGYFIREDDVANDKLIINFTGGGACADAVSCDTSKEPTYFKDLGITRLLIDGGYGLGIFGAEHADNPVNGWTHFVIPNCTGDLNVGDKQVTYTRADKSTFKINHAGAPNTRAALAWLRAHYDKLGQDPKTVVVVGSSAGAYAAIVWAAAVREAFPDSQVRQFADSGAGVGDDQTGAFPAIWNPTASYPAWVPGLDPAKDDVAKLGLNDIYKREAAYYPDVEFAQFNYNRDQIQSFFVQASGGDPSLWTLGLYLKMTDLIVNVPNFHSYIADGEKHAILVLPQLYDVATNGDKLTTWFSDYINGKPPRNVTAWPFPPAGSKS